jgi:uncharacterized protein
VQIRRSANANVIVLRLDPGEDMLLALEEATRQHAIRHAMILGAIGSVKSYHYHVVETPTVPPVDAFVKGEAPLDIVGLSGYVLDGRVHAHVTFSDRQRALGGHLEPGCTVLTFCLISLVESPDLDLTDADRWWGDGPNPYLAQRAGNQQ